MADDRSAMAAQVARMFFDRQMSKVEIAARLHISRYRVARLIDEALVRGIVRLEFRDVPPQDRLLARRIEEKWGIDLCAVATGRGGETDPKTMIARLAADIIASLISEGSRIGIAWGSTMAAVVDEMPARSTPSVSVVQLAGSSTRVARSQTPGELARRLAERLGGSYQPLFAPAFVESAELRDALLRQPEIQETVAAFEQLDLAIVGIGAMARDGSRPRSSLIESGVLDERNVEELSAAGAVGDLILYPFDRDGNFVAQRVIDCAIVIPINRLRKVPSVVAVAGGAAKAEAIRGALSTGVVRILVTDQEAANLVAAD